MKRLDRLAFILIIIGGILSALFGPDDGSGGRRPSPDLYEPSPAAPSPVLPSGPRRPLPPASTFDPEFRVAPSDKGDSTGTAFSVGKGVWLTAKHVTHGCDRVALVRRDRKLARVAGVTEHPRADVAVIRTNGGTDGFGLRGSELLVGEDGYMFGFPQGKPGNVHGTLLGRARSVSGRVRLNAEPVIAWSEVRRAPALDGSLGGLSGGPALDADGRIVGVVSSESARRGRVMTAAPVSLREVLALAGVTPAPAIEPAIDPATFPRIGDRLRANLNVAQVYCDVF
jgi:S1-C subfamily serine protease